MYIFIYIYIYIYMYKYIYIYIYIYMYIYIYIYLYRLRYKRRVNHLIRQKKIDTTATLTIQKFVRGEVYICIYIHIRDLWLRFSQSI
jgi:hypothetical protein